MCQWLGHKLLHLCLGSFTLYEFLSLSSLGIFCLGKLLAGSCVVTGILDILLQLLGFQASLHCARSWALLIFLFKLFPLGNAVCSPYLLAKHGLMSSKLGTEVMVHLCTIAQHWEDTVTSDPCFPPYTEYMPYGCTGTRTS